LRAAGLDPERAPRTLAELDAYCEILTKYDEDGNIVQMGFLPQEPGWYHWAWGPWFGGTLMDEEGRITANHRYNVEAFEWLRGFAVKYGVEQTNRFASGFGNFGSPQNPFFSGKLAMVIQGVWMHNYISQYAPGMQWGVAPWPKTPHGPEDFSVAGCDIMVIPAGVPEDRRDAAWEFVKYVSSREGMELLTLGQRKNTPLAEVSEGFLENHPHPYIDLFIDMSRYEHVVPPYPTGVWMEYMKEMFYAFERMRILETNPATGRPYTAEESLDICQRRIARAHARHEASLALRSSVVGRSP
jgi:ABC-type glycerol-3-phosphate transport system substrate-binding protein